MTRETLKEQIAETIRHYNAKGWSPATSTNYSFKDDEGTIWVSRSGVDKSQFTANDFITVLIPEFEPRSWWQRLLHNQTGWLLHFQLILRKNVVVITVPYHLEK